MSLARGRHARPLRSRLRRRALAVAAVAALVLLTGLLGTRGTLALWNADAASIGGGTVRSGTASLYVGVMPALRLTALGPGTSTVGAFSVTNQGSVPLSVRVATTSTKVSYVSPTPDATVLGATTLHLASVTSAAACTPGLGGASGPIATFDTGSGYYTLPAGVKAYACLEVTLAADAPQSVSGAVVDFTVTVSGTQVPR